MGREGREGRIDQRERNQRKSLLYADHKSYKRAGNAVLQLCVFLSFSFTLTPTAPLHSRAATSRFLFSSSYIAGVRATRRSAQRATLGTVCQLVERDSNSIGCLCLPTCLVLFVSVLCPVPSFARTPSRPGKTRRLGFSTFTSNVHPAPTP